MAVDRPASDRPGNAPARCRRGRKVDATNVRTVHGFHTIRWTKRESGLRRRYGVAAVLKPREAVISG